MQAGTARAEGRPQVIEAVEIFQMAPDGEAANAGLRPGDVILAVDGRAIVGGRGEFERVAGGRAVALHVMRDHAVVRLAAPDPSLRVESHVLIARTK